MKNIVMFLRLLASWLFTALMCYLIAGALKIEYDFIIAMVAWLIYMVIGITITVDNKVDEQC